MHSLITRRIEGQTCPNVLIISTRLADRNLEIIDQLFDEITLFNSLIIYSDHLYDQISFLDRSKVFLFCSKFYLNLLNVLFLCLCICEKIHTLIIYIDFFFTFSLIRKIHYFFLFYIFAWIAMSREIDFLKLSVAFWFVRSLRRGKWETLSANEIKSIQIREFS